MQTISFTEAAATQRTDGRITKLKRYTTRSIRKTAKTCDGSDQGGTGRRRHESVCRGEHHVQHGSVKIVTRPTIGRHTAALAAVIIGLVTGAAQAIAQDASSGAEPTTERQVLRFATTDDFPPFNARDEENALVGFNIDLAQAICLDLNRTCEITTYPWNTLFDVLARGQVDALIASHRINVETLSKADFTTPYFRTPGRFAARRDGGNLTVSPNGLDRESIGVARGTAHEAFIQTFFRTSRIERFESPEAARAALRDKKVKLIFDDGISLIFWINGTASRGCCDLAGGPYLEPLFFGDGIGIALRKGNRALRQELNQSLVSVRENGRMLELMQRYFPRRVY